MAAAGLSLTLVTPSQVAAATIFGTIQDRDRALENVRIELVCDGKRESQKTDARGTYRFTVRWTGRCQLQVEGGGSALVILYDEPTRYDFEVGQEGGQRRLMRR